MVVVVLKKMALERYKRLWVAEHKSLVEAGRDRQRKHPHRSQNSTSAHHEQLRRGRRTPHCRPRRRDKTRRDMLCTSHHMERLRRLCRLDRYKSSRIQHCTWPDSYQLVVVEEEEEEDWGRLHSSLRQ